MVLWSSSISLLIFWIGVFSIVEREVLKSPAILVDLSISTFRSITVFVSFFFFLEEESPWANIYCQSSSTLYMGHCHSMAWWAVCRSAPRIQTCKPQATKVEHRNLTTTPLGCPPNSVFTLTTYTWKFWFRRPGCSTHVDPPLKMEMPTNTSESGTPWTVSLNAQNKLSKPCKQG